MRLVCDDGSSVELSIRGYQFPSIAGGSRRGDNADWDANWLMIHGSAGTANGERWTFSEPCLTTWEASTLLGFLQRVTAGQMSTCAERAEGQRTVEFVEPNIAFEEVDIQSDPRTIDVLLSHGCAAPVELHPAMVDEADNRTRIRIRTSSQNWRSAAQAWATDITAFPQR